MLGTLLGAVIALVPGAHAAQEPLCRPQPEQRTTRLEDYQAIRRRYGFRADAAYVRSLIRRGLVFTVDVERFPMTRRERRYVQLRDRLQLDDAPERYMRRHRDVDGGISLEDDWPRDPYILVRVTRDRLEHQRALRRVVRHPRLLRTRRVALSERALRRIQDRIDWRAAERDGIHVVSTGPDIDATTVDLEVITERTDAAEYLRARYGPRIRVRVIATTRYSPGCTRLRDAQAGPGPSELTIGWEAGGGAVFDHVEIAEYDDRVVIGVVAQVPNGPRTAEGRRAQHTLTLSRPLGDRNVIDATTGRRVGRREPS